MDRSFFSRIRRSAGIVTVVGSLGALALAACSDDPDDNAIKSPDAGAADAATTGDSAAPDSAAPDTGAADGATADAGTDAAPVAVRCTQAEFDATDHTGTNGVDITFPNAGPPAQYTQRCAKVKVGQHVGFYGNFTAHPLEPNGGDSPSFIPASTASGTALDLTATAVGTYGFQCSFHPASMYGAVQVVP